MLFIGRSTQNSPELSSNTPQQVLCFIMVASRELLSLNIFELRMLRSTCTCAQSQQSLISPLLRSTAFSNSENRQRMLRSECPDAQTF